MLTVFGETDDRCFLMTRPAELKIKEFCFLLDAYFLTVICLVVSNSTVSGLNLFIYCKNHTFNTK